jgi:diaminopimelate epimerase
MKNVSFVKMSGAGNDFIIFDKKNYPALKLKDEIIKKLCDRRNGIGADGIITIADNGKYDFLMEYFNADGSTGSLCGNGSRCAIKFAQITGRLKSEEVNFISNNKVYKGEIIDDEKIKFFFNDIENLKLNISINAYNQLIKASYLNTGSPHVIININDLVKDQNDPRSVINNIDEVPVFEIGKEIRYLKEFSPGGTNVNFINTRDNKVYIRTYERGVENETLACGTGAAASAVIASLKYGVSSPVKLVPRGGDELIVDFVIKENEIKGLAITGSARVTFTGEITETVFS